MCIRNKRIATVLMGIILICVILAGRGGTVSAGQWRSNSNGLWYHNDDDSCAVSRWIQEAGKWYYLDADGSMHTGWLHYNKDVYYLDDNGAMVTGDQTIDEMNLHFADSGVLMKGTEATQWSVTSYADPNDNVSMFYTIMDNLGDLVVVDGGWNENADYVRKIIHQKGDVVTAWILTHPHPDHIGAFNEIYSNPKTIKINKIYDDNVDYQKYKAVAQSWDKIEVYERYLKITAGDMRITHLKRNDTFNLIGLQAEVLNAYDSLVEQYGSDDLCNNGSLVIRLSGKQQKMLFTADIKDSMSKYLLKTSASKLQADIVQMSHHGNEGAATEFYDAVHPTAAIFDAPTWLFQNENYTTDQNVSYCNKKGIQIYNRITAPNSFCIQ